jgi:hypothetical protein
VLGITVGGPGYRLSPIPGRHLLLWGWAACRCVCASVRRCVCATTGFRCLSALSSRPKRRDLARPKSARSLCWVSPWEVPDIGYRRFRDDICCCGAGLRVVASVRLRGFGVYLPCRPGRSAGTSHVQNLHGRCAGYHRGRSRISAIADSGTTFVAVGLGCASLRLCVCAAVRLCDYGVSVSLGPVVPAEAPGPRTSKICTVAVLGITVGGPGYRLSPIPGRHLLLWGWAACRCVGATTGFRCLSSLSSRPKRRDLARPKSARSLCWVSPWEVPDIGYRRFRDDICCCGAGLRVVASVRLCGGASVRLRGFGVSRPCRPGRSAGTSHVQNLHGRCAGYHRWRSRISAIADSGTTFVAVGLGCASLRLCVCAAVRLCGGASVRLRGFGVSRPCRPGRSAGTSHVQNLHGRCAGYHRWRSRISAIADSGTTFVAVGLGCVSLRRCVGAGPLTR